MTQSAKTSLLFPNSPQAVICDMDGLLFDTERIYMTAVITAGRAVGFEIGEELCHAMIGVPERECDLMLQARFGATFPMAEYVHECGKRLARLTESSIPLKPGAIELLAYLSWRRIPTAIATSSSRKTTQRYLQTAGLSARFDALITCDEVEHGKPWPDLFVKAAEHLGIEPKHCLAVEDSPNGIRSAHAAGTMPIMVPDILPPTDDIRALCIAVVDSLHDVRRLMTAAEERT